MAYCGWPVNVNKIILDSTTVTVGEGATVTDSLENGGQKKSRLTCGNPPDKFSVTMAFDFSEKQYDGYTEIENFWTWYKFVHKYGTVPFQFPAILINSNRQQGYSQEDVGYGKIPDTEYYRITSAVEGAKSGLSQEVTMTWETYATGVIQIEEEEFGIDHIEPVNGEIKVILSETSPSYEPNSGTWSVSCVNSSGASVAITITNCIFDGDRTAMLYFDKFTTAGVYTVTVGGKSRAFAVS